ncbi:Hpt domain-containing protein [Pseudoduganella lutea]|uniref:Hpt domain-containing protein n=1 Tax=Pseudoduganella lutea TaxID=321985 RepID=A0A4P6L4M8_9BURK|nr:Hpt domain-containing protein [Pseudoduganella lutea]QBE66549.1 Hpt domain-containing protein [Pseudoduganella lutea]
MATPLDPNYRARLQALGDMFAASIPTRMAAIADALAAAGMSPDRAKLETLHHALHTVAGSAGSFGFTVLGEQARRLEQAVRGVMDGGPGWQLLVPEIQHYLDWARNDARNTAFPAHD